MTPASTVPAPSLTLRLRHADPSSYFVYVGFVLIFAVMAITLRRDGFLDPQNLYNIVLQTTPITVMAVGAVFVLSTGEIDLSIGAVVALSALVSAVTLRDHGLVPGLLAGLAVGLVVGLVNGLLITKLRLPSFLVTLGMMGLVTGLAQRVTNLQAVPSIDELYNGLLGSGSIAGISSLLFWAALFVLVGHYLYRHTRTGAHVLASGDNIRAARVSGIKVDRIKIGVMVPQLRLLPTSEARLPDRRPCQWAGSRPRRRGAPASEPDNIARALRWLPVVAMRENGVG